MMILVSCDQNKKDQTKQSSNENFQMYSMSEMARLMENMAQEHKNVKTKVLANDSLGSIPDYYYDIHFATFTDESDNDEFFKKWADLYLAAEENLYKKQTVEAFDNAINVCLQCHQQKCGGPIPRIKKLFINSYE
ncbi:hypothetical protein [Pustulibacterium marinum]|nr:hypothetical protein [Pustulibacterium marinum]